MDIIFSYLYLDNYRSIRRREISFDHRYKMDMASSIVIKNIDTETSFGSYFYGKNIYSATCLVGRNGEGKSSFIDFLRDSFALIKFNLDSGNLSYLEGRNGVVNLTEDELRKYHLDSGICFFIIFKCGDSEYYVTNMKDVSLASEVENSCHAYIPKKGGGDIDYRVAYFSMMRFPDGVAIEQHAFIREIEEQEPQTDYWNNKIYDIQMLSEQYMFDFSEESFNSLRERKRRRGGFNLDLLMQMAFLFSDKKDVLENILGKEYSERINLLSIELSGVQINFKSLEEESDETDSLILSVLEDTTAYFWPFSSGQYSRFTFLARLYWFMGGGDQFMDSERMKRILKKNIIRWYYEFEQMRKFSLNSSSVILLIDEGELYYHPEWQRCFVKDVFDIISEYGGEGKSVNVQVVFTTSSTFMLSDILREDVVVLSEPNDKQKSYLDMNLQTYGQNIHMLLANRFFMDSTIGEGSKKLITSLFDALSIRKIKEDDGTEKDEEPVVVRQRVRDTVDKLFPAYIRSHEEDFTTDSGYDWFVERLIGSIGEEFYRRQLLGLFQEYKRFVLKNTDELSRKLKEVQSKLEQGSPSEADVKSAIELLKQIRKEGML